MRRSSKIWLAAALALVSSGSLANAQYVDPVEVETSAFGQDTFAIGSLSVSEGAFTGNLWQGTEAANIAFLLDNLPARLSNPAQADLLRRVLLSPGEGPRGTTSELTGKKLMALARAGYYEQAASFAELSGNLSNEPMIAQSAAYADMMRGDLNDACLRGAALRSGRNDPFWLKLRFICYSVAGEADAADLTFGLMRDQDILTQSDAVLFSALATGTKPKTTILPSDGFQYATIRQLQLPLDLKRLDEVEGSVLVALARETEAPAEARILAAERAVHFGMMSERDLADLFAEFDFPVERLGAARELLDQQPGNNLVDALAFQAIRQMTAIEFAGDRATLVGAALRAADTFERFEALAAIYAPMAAQFEVMPTYSTYAPEYALAGILAENDGLAARWVTALATDPARTDGMEQALALLELWSLRDENRAQVVGGYAGLTVTRPEISIETLNDVTVADEADLIADLVRISLAPEGQRSTGQAALISLVASAVEADGELEVIRQYVIESGIRNSGIDDIFAQREFAVRATDLIADMRSSSSGAGASSTATPAAGIKPRVKPTVSD